VAKFGVEFKPSADRALQRLPVDAQKRIVIAAEGLADDPYPHGAKQLSGMIGIWRIRVGRHRIVYEVHRDRKVVMVLRVAHRKDVYRDL
jgi:mRNA interferase RelE/StbE